jgi:hypothetical protein
MTIAEAIYLLCAATSLVAAGLLLRQYRRSRTALLFWSSVGFVALSLNNVLVYVDLVLVPSRDMAVARTLAGAVGILSMLYGLIDEVRG